MKFSNSLIIQWGLKTTDTDGIARFTLPISFSDTNYSLCAMHHGGDIASSTLLLAYKHTTNFPIAVIQDQNFAKAGGWLISYIAIGY